MTRNAHAAAFALSLVMTLSIFSSVAQLKVPSHAGADTAQVALSQ
jgi:hypothetical protein